MASTSTDGTEMGALEYRWILIYYHAGAEQFRDIGLKWFDSLEHCKKVAEDLDFDFCCSYAFEYESRAKEVNQVTALDLRVRNSSGSGGKTQEQ